MAVALALAVAVVPAAYAATPEQQVDQAIQHARTRCGRSSSGRAPTERSPGGCCIAPRSSARARRAVGSRLSTTGGVPRPVRREAQGRAPRRVARDPAACAERLLLAGRTYPNGLRHLGDPEGGHGVLLDGCVLGPVLPRPLRGRAVDHARRKRAFADATLGNYTPLGCVGHTHDRPTITYDGFGNRRAR